MSDEIKSMMNQQNEGMGNIMEIQQKMLLLQQRMMTEGATPEILQLMQEYQNEMINSAMNTGAMQMGAVYDGDDESEDIDAFVEAHPQPADKVKFLCMGGMLVTLNDEPAFTLEMMDEKSDYVEQLSNAWDIDGRDDLLEMLESLLKGRAYSNYNDTFLAIKSGHTDDVDEDDIENYQDAVEGLRDIAEISVKEINKCESILAWDIERAAYLTRVGAHIGYLSNDEAWGYLKRAALVAKEHFEDWKIYTVSVVLGRAVHMGYNPGYLYAAEELLTDEPDFYNAHPLKDM